MHSWQSQVHNLLGTRTRVEQKLQQREVATLWLVFVFGLMLSLVGVSIRRGYDFVQTVGFLFSNFGLIFGAAVVVGLALYGLSILLEGPEVHKSHRGDDDHSGDMANLVP